MNELTPDHNNLLPVNQQSNDNGRAIEEVRASIIVAKKFLRNESDALKNIIKSCKRPSLAQVAMYSYPRGGQQVTGASIHLLKTIARHWGNIKCGVRCIEQRDGESLMEAYACDLETNYRPNREFIVRHEIMLKNKMTKQLVDPRDIYELEANMGARRLRACLIDIIPRDILDEAIATCDKTLESGDTTPIEQRAAKMLSVMSEIGVTKEMIEQFLKHKLEAINPQELLNLHKVYMSIKDGYAPREQYFNLEKLEEKSKVDELNDLVKGKK